MKKLTLEQLDTYRHPPDLPDMWVRVGMDTGGIAAGADKVYEALVKERDALDLPVSIKQTGTLGLAFADPVVEIGRDGQPPVVWGSMDAEGSVELMRKYFKGQVLPEVRVMASRDHSSDLGGQEQVTLLVKDTTSEGADRTPFLACPLVEDPNSCLRIVSKWISESSRSSTRT